MTSYGELSIRASKLGLHLQKGEYYGYWLTSGYGAAGIVGQYGTLKEVERFLKNYRMKSRIEKGYAGGDVKRSYERGYAISLKLGAHRPKRTGEHINSEW